MEDNQLLYSESGNLVIVRVEGKGTWVESKPFLEFAKRKMEEGRELVIDLSDCKILDSTFLGSIAYLALKKGKIEVFRPSKEVKRAIRTLGLGKIIKEIEISREEQGKKILKEKLSPRERAETLLLAHKSLIEVSPKNLPKFKDLIEMVEKELEKK